MRWSGIKTVWLTSGRSLPEINISTSCLTNRWLKEGEEAAERLAVFYTCLGLGFVGWNTGQPEVIKRKMVELAPRIRNFVESDDSAKICPDAYKHTNTANLPLPVGTKLLGIVILFVGLVLVVAVANIILFQESSSNLYQALDSVRKNDPAAGAQR